MTTCADIIRRAHRLMGTLSAGQEPAGADASDSMERLQSVILDLPGLYHNARWNEIATETDYTAEEGDRITVTSPGTVDLPLTITPSDADTRPPLDFARVYILSADEAANGLWIYVASAGKWRRVTGLTINDDFPLGEEDVDGMAAQLAVALVDEYGDSAMIGPRTLAKAQQSVRSLRARIKKADPFDYNRPSFAAVAPWPDYV